MVKCGTNRKDAHFPEEIWNDLHLQMIWYGREYSPARGWDLEKILSLKLWEGKQS
jgi:endonuclease III